MPSRSPCPTLDSTTFMRAIAAAWLARSRLPICTPARGLSCTGRLFHFVRIALSLYAGFSAASWFAGTVASSALAAHTACSILVVACEQSTLDPELELALAAAPPVPVDTLDPLAVPPPEPVE